MVAFNEYIQGLQLLYDDLAKENEHLKARLRDSEAKQDAAQEMPAVQERAPAQARFTPEEVTTLNIATTSKVPKPATQECVQEVDMDLQPVAGDRELSASSLTSTQSSSAAHRVGVKMLDASKTKLRKLMSLSPNLPLTEWIDCNKGHVVSTSDILDTMIRTEDVNVADYGVISPISTRRLIWDLCAVIILLCELWITPIDLVFFHNQDSPKGFRHFSIVTTVFFSLDIMLNFNTGYVEKETPVMHRPKIMRKYLRCWFWLDLVATIPFDFLVDRTQREGSFAHLIRLGKATRMLKNIRYLKVARAVRLAKTHGRPSKFVTHMKAILSPLRIFKPAVLVLMCLSILAHFIGCVWAYRIRESSDDEKDERFSHGDAFRSYYESFLWAYVNLTGGLYEGTVLMNYDSLNVMGVDILVVSVRVALVLVAIKLFAGGTVRVDVEGNDARNVTMKDRALEYLRGHKVSFAAQLQILQCINETSKVTSDQKSFDELMSNQLPPTVRGMVSEELWSRPLRSFPVFQALGEWDSSVIRELALSVREEVLASHVIVFKEGEKSTSAYYIIGGRLAVGTKLGQQGQAIRDYTEGMWVGEKSLFNPLLRRSASVVTMTMTTLMVVDSQDFHDILTRQCLVERFHEYCKRNLWKGLCTRCGSMGHWPDECPNDYCQTTSVSLVSRFTQYATSAPSLPSQQDSTMSSKLSGASHRPKATSSVRSLFGHDLADPHKGETISGDLKTFLTYQNLLFLVPHLVKMHLRTLDNLIESDLGQVNADMLRRLGSADDHERELFERSPFEIEHIVEFRAAAEAKVAAMLYFGKYRAQHLMFLSHYKVEAGTEAALMRSEFETVIKDIPSSVGNRFDAPVFLDSEDLRNLDQLVQQVQRSHNLVILLTDGILQRPWCLVEIVTAVREGIPLVPVVITKPGLPDYRFPDDDWYRDMSNGKCLAHESIDLLKACGIELPEVSVSVKEIFKIIALPYAPQQSASVRRAQIEAIFANCKLKSTDVLDL